MKRVVFVSLVVAACGGKSSPAPEKKTVDTDQPALPSDVAEKEEGAIAEPPPEPEQPPPPPPPAMSGVWVSSCVAMRQGGQILTATMTADAFEFALDAFSDPACKTKHMTVRLSGTYAVGDESTAVPGAWNVDATLIKRDLTVATPQGAKTLGKLCKIKKMKPNKTYDIHTAGCTAIGIPPAESCATVHDLIAQEGSRAYLGVRPPDGDQCSPEKRPTAVDRAWALAYQWPSTGLPECDQFATIVDTVSTCDNADAPSRNRLFAAVQDTLEQLAVASAATSDPAVKQAMAEGCAQGVEASMESLASTNCPMP